MPQLMSDLTPLQRMWLYENQLTGVDSYEEADERQRWDSHYNNQQYHQQNGRPPPPPPSSHHHHQGYSHHHYQEEPEEYSQHPNYQYYNHYPEYEQYRGEQEPPPPPPEHRQDLPSPHDQSPPYFAQSLDQIFRKPPPPSPSDQQQDQDVNARQQDHQSNQQSPSAAQLQQLVLPPPPPPPPPSCARKRKHDQDNIRISPRSLHDGRNTTARHTSHNHHPQQHHRGPRFPHHGEKLTWQQSLENLRVYRDHYGNCNVPQKYSGNPKLGRWVNKQRKKKKNPIKYGALTDSQIEQLEDLGFVWHQ